MKKKAFFALFLAMVLALSSLAGCAGQTADSKNDSASGKTRPTTKGKEENSFTMALTNQVTTFDPQLFALQAEDIVIVQMYDPLFYVLNDGSLENVLLESYTKNEDGSVDFVLKSGVKFHSGDTLTSEDVEYTLSRCTNSSLCSILPSTIVMTIQDDTHFKWEFPAADLGAGFDELAAYVQAMCIVNKSYCETILSTPNDNLGFNVDGTGAYTLESRTENGDVTLKRFADYHGTASIDTLYFKYVSGSQELAFEAGDLDYALYGAANYELIKEYSNVYAYAQALNNVAFVIQNCAEGKATNDLRVRQALAYCLNRDDICSIGSSDSGTVAYNLATPLAKYYADVCDHYDQDVNKANSLMTEAGYSDSHRAELTLIVTSSQTDWVSACEIMKEELEKSYFTVTIEQVADTSRYMIGDFDIAMISIGLTTQFNSYSVLFDSSTGMNLAMYEDDGTILNTFNAIQDEATAHAAMKAATETMAYVPLFYPTVFPAFDANLNTGDFYSSISTFLFREFSWK